MDTSPKFKWNFCSIRRYSKGKFLMNRIWSDFLLRWTRNKTFDRRKGRGEYFQLTFILSYSVGSFSVCKAYANLVPDFVDLQQCMAHGLFSWAGTQYVLNNQDNDIGVKVESISLAADPFFYSFERLQCKVIQATKGFPNNEECHVSLLPLSTVENISPILTLYFGCNSNVSILQLSGVMSDDSSNISPGEVFRKAWNLIREQWCNDDELELWSH